LPEINQHYSCAANTKKNLQVFVVQWVSGEYAKSETPDKCANQRVGQRPTDHRNQNYIFSL